MQLTLFSIGDRVAQEIHSDDVQHATAHLKPARMPLHT